MNMIDREKVRDAIKTERDTQLERWKDMGDDEYTLSAIEHSFAMALKVVRDMV